MRYATWQRRAAALLIDYGILIPLPAIAVFVSSRTTAIWLIVADAVLLIGNRWLLAGYNGRTFGRTIMWIKLAGAQGGRPIGVVSAFWRDICHVLDSVVLGLGWLRPLWNKKHQTIADSIVSSVVLRD